MFTGIVEERGTVVSIEPRADSADLVVDASVVCEDASAGDSIAVNGVCLTIRDLGQGRFGVDVMGETLARTTVGDLRAGAPVNLERAVRADSRLGGHVVQGHVDAVATIVRREPSDDWERVRIEVPPTLARYLVEKGSVAVDGVSLTVSAVSGPQESRAWFEVGLIPTTMALTTLGSSPPGTRVNIEVDVLAKYVERVAAFAERAVLR